MAGGRASGAGRSGPVCTARRAALYGSPVAAIRARAAFFAERSEVMASSIHGAGNPRFPGRLDRHDRARERRESVTLVLVTSQPTWAAAARRRAGATASAIIITAPPPSESAATGRSRYDSAHSI